MPSPSMPTPWLDKLFFVLRDCFHVSTFSDRMDFLFKDRGSGKRTIKPSKDSESLEACMAAEESDDSDFEVRKMHNYNNIVGEKDNSGEMMRMILTTDVSL